MTALRLQRQRSSPCDCCAAMALVQNLFIVGSDKARSQFRVLIIDRTQLFKLEVRTQRHLCSPASHPPHSHAESSSRSLSVLSWWRTPTCILPPPSSPVCVSSSTGAVTRWSRTSPSTASSASSPCPSCISCWSPRSTRSAASPRAGSTASPSGRSCPSPSEARSREEREGRRGRSTGRGKTGKYRELISAHIDLTKDFYFSYYYDLTHSLQHNLSQTPEAAPIPTPLPHPSPQQRPTAPEAEEAKEKEGSKDSTSPIVKSVSTPAFPSRSSPVPSAGLSPADAVLLQGLTSSPGQGSRPLSPPLHRSASFTSNPWANLEASFAAAANAPAATAGAPSTGSSSSASPTSPASPAKRHGRPAGSRRRTCRRCRRARTPTTSSSCGTCTWCTRCCRCCLGDRTG